MKYCKSCLIPDSRPDQYFNENYVCNACLNYETRKTINWGKRLDELKKIIHKIKNNDNSNWDCVIPSSGGKDSTYQALRARELGLNPVLVTATTCDLSEIGRKNIENLKNLGFDTFEISPDKITRAKLNKLCLQEIGDIAWPEHISIFTIPIKFALNYRIPLILWGENPQFDYGGPKEQNENKTLNRKWLEEFGGLLGLRVTDLIQNYGFNQSNLYPYIYPTEEELSKFKITSLFLGYFEPWDSIRNADIAIKNNFSIYEKAIENGYLDCEKLDNYQHGIHDYFKYLKYGFGRATDQLSLLIRRKVISREEAIKKVSQHEGKFPSSYLGKSLIEILKKIGISINEFTEICDKFTNKKIFKCDQSGKIIKKDNGSLIKLNNNY
jgi:N-acetyl sugar amidotransferase